MNEVVRMECVLDEMSEGGNHPPTPPSRPHLPTTTQAQLLTLSRRLYVSTAV
jgi:hypothetical protein